MPLYEYSFKCIILVAGLAADARLVR